MSKANQGNTTQRHNWYSDYIKTAQAVPGQPAIDMGSELTNIVDEFINNIGRDIFMALLPIIQDTLTSPTTEQAVGLISQRLDPTGMLHNETRAMLKAVSAEVAHRILSEAAEGRIAQNIGATLNVSSSPEISSAMQNWLNVAKSAIRKPVVPTGR